MSENIKIVTARRTEEDYVEYEEEDIDSYFGLKGSGMTGGAVRGEKALSHSFLMDTLRKVMGRTLTIIDASLLDKQQNKAVKDLIRNIFSDEMEFSADRAFDQKEMDKLIPQDIEPEELESVSIEEALGVN